MGSLASGMALLLAACGSGEGEDRPGTPDVEIIGGAGSVSISGVVEGYGEELYEPSTDQSLNLAIGLDLKDIREIMAVAVGGGAVDWAAALAIYEDGKNQVEPNDSTRSLAELAADASTEVFPDAEAVYGRAEFVDGIIRDGLNGTGRAAGLSDRSRRQIVDKGIQMLMYGESMARLAEAEAAMAAGDAEKAAEAVDAAWAILSGQRDENGSPNNGLLATGVGREDDFSFQGRLSRPLEASLFSALAAAQQNNAATFEREVAASRAYVNTILYLSTLRLADVLPGDARESDREGHLAEGWTFFQALRAQVAAASPESAAAVEAAYSAAASERFSREQAAEVYAAMNTPEVLAALGIPDEFRVEAP